MPHADHPRLHRLLAAHCGRSREPAFSCIVRRAQGAGRGRCGAQTACPSLRCGCPAMLGLPAPLQNSLRSLRSLWSNSCNESEHQARGYARGRQACASRQRRFAPPRPRPPPCRLQGRSSRRRTPPLVVQRGSRPGPSAHLRRRAAQRQRPARVPRASCSDSLQMSEQRERSERRKFCNGAADASSAGQSQRSEDRLS